MKGIRSGPRNFFRKRLINILLERDVRGKHILDAGCGDGSLALGLAKRGARVWAVDIDEAWCNMVKERAHNKPYKDNIAIVCSSLTDVALPPTHFDYVLCGDVLEHIDDDEKVLFNFHRLLKPSGALIISVPLDARQWDVSDEMVGHKRLYDVDNFCFLIERAHFCIKRRFLWGYPFMSAYHKYVFVPWAKRAEKEDEIRKESMLFTRIGKSRLASWVGAGVFFLDLIFSSPKSATGIMVKAKKV